jgi:hypothetical protein
MINDDKAITKELIGYRKPFSRRRGSDDGEATERTQFNRCCIVRYDTIRYDTCIVSSNRNDSGDSAILRYNATVRIVSPLTRTVSYDSYRESYDTEITVINQSLETIWYIFWGRITEGLRAPRSTLALLSIYIWVGLWCYA